MASPSMPGSEVSLSFLAASPWFQTSGPNRPSRLALFFLILAAASAQTTTTPSSKTLSQVIDGYTAAVGGKAALDGISSWQITGKPPGSGPMGRTSLVLYWKAPSKALQLSKSTFATVETGYDGKQGWYLPQHGRSHHMTQEKVDLLLLTCNPLRFVHLQQIYPGATLEGEAKLDGQRGGRCPGAYLGR